MSPLLTPPAIMHLASSKEERRSVFHQQSVLSSLSTYLRNYESAVLLLEHSTASLAALLRQITTQQDTSEHDDEELKYADWAQMAARDATLTVFHIGHALNALSFRDVPSLAAAVDGKRLKAARFKFQKNFGDIHLARNAVAHDAERFSSPAKVDEVRYDGGYQSDQVDLAGRGHALSDFLDGDKLIATVKDPRTGETEVVSSAINRTTLGTLRDIVADAFSAYPAR